jgi:hypothetical protein
VAAVVVLGGLYFYVQGDGQDPKESAAVLTGGLQSSTSDASPALSPTPTVSTTPSQDLGAAPASPSALPTSPSPSPSEPGDQDFPANASGVFTTATGGTKAFGTGTLKRYKVDVEDGLDRDPETFANQVDVVLGDTERGWTAGGEWSFQRVDSGPVDFVVHLASPGTTDDLCGKYGLDTGGEVNCSGGSDVVVNIKRWLLLTPFYTGKPDDYHALVVNHEVGHFLGQNHVTCPGVGKPAPAMMQQIKGLHGCVINGWVYDKGTYITGPAS